ncbi:hypothetical protein CSAL01_05262 [Colletotrichum salicis]|uniref:Uncharacterized protein n=1 Tax=Colletotrichum salicis TaxID=1209931 RepID=A0A135V5J2_9PEZI|nr:hypothetical protein CSAL01_05262 [Colletotrichum salicis]
MHTTNDVSIPANGLPLAATLSTLSARKSHLPILHMYSGCPKETDSQRHFRRFSFNLHSYLEPRHNFRDLLVARLASSDLVANLTTSSTLETSS